MPRRAKTSVLFFLAGVLTAAAAPLNTGQKNPAFSPGPGRSFTKAVVLKPGANPVWGRTPRWSGVKVQAITPGPQSPAKVEVGAHTFRAAGEAAAAKPDIQPAGRSR